MNKKSKKRETSGGRAPEAECKRIFQSLETVLVVTPDWDREEGVVLASTERRPGMLPNIVHSTGQPPTTKNQHVQMSVVPRLRRE